MKERRNALWGSISMAAMLLLLCASCRKAPQWRLAQGAVWNTTYRIVYNSPEDLSDSIQAVMSAIEMSLSPFNEHSLISRINRNETDSTDALIDTVFAISREVSHATGGRFDPTVSPLVNLWGFGYDRQARRDMEEAGDSPDFIVPRENIDSALRLVGIGACRIDNHRIVKKHPSTTFNFSAVTKGFGCDMIADMLRRNGSDNHMVEIGGEIALDGHNPEGEAWRIQIDTPQPDEAGIPHHEALQIVKLTGRHGVATSGNYRNFHNTARYGRIGHTIDPVSGMPVHTDVASATIIAPTAALADAWATACMASDADSALRAVNSTDGIECLLVRIAPDSTFSTLPSANFPTK